MKACYPASDQLSQLNSTQRALKIARHSPCAACDGSCSALHPPPDVDVVLDQQITNESSLGDLGQYGSDDDDFDLSYLGMCACGHGVRDHNADETQLEQAEFARRTRVAIRLDELLQDVGKLLDFNYSDDDIVSLRRQMRVPVSLVSPRMPTTSSPEQQLSSPTSSVLSDLPPNKRRRISISPLSDAYVDDDDEEEDKPLAARMGLKTSARAEKTSRLPASKRAGQTRGKTSYGDEASVMSSVEGGKAQERAFLNGIDGHVNGVKVEDVMDHSQLSRLAAGVTIDTNANAPAGHVPLKTEKIAVTEMRRGVIQITPVENDSQPRSFVILSGLKTLFQKQLPNMPREYIARLVFDTNSRGLAIIKRGYKVVGGICFRPFPQRGFAEIVFFATASADQEKGYGGMLMDHFKAHIKSAYPEMLHFLTYADNYAVGYFEKQGFSKDITLDRSIWAAYIKDYEGGTIMQCTMLKKVNYLDKSFLAVQQEAVMTKIRQMSRSHIVYPGLPQFQPGMPEDPVDPKEVPGLRESGWTSKMTMEDVRPSSRNADNYHLERILKELKDHPRAWAFLKPVKAEEVTDYYEVIKNPMDFETMQSKLEHNQYPSLEAFLADTQLIFDNCKTYNPETSIYHRNTLQLEIYLKELLAEEFKREG